jgi:hypothetical protein
VSGVSFTRGSQPLNTLSSRGLLSSTLMKRLAGAAFNFQEITMAIQTSSKKWVQMSAGEKAAFIGKLCIFIVSFGFAFPTLLND